MALNKNILFFLGLSIAFSQQKDLFIKKSVAPVPPSPPRPPLHPKEDDSSFANIDEIRAFHYDLDFFVNFDEQRVQGNMTIQLFALANNVTQVILDQANLNINQIVDSNGTKLAYKIQTISPNVSDPILGAPLIIYLPHVFNQGNQTNITITYQTTGHDSALSWLTPEQTAGKDMPYVYTQNEPAYGRSWFPSQDTPSVKVAYTARVTIKKGFVVKMSAKDLQQVDLGNGFIQYYFTQRIEVPSYLITFAAGNLVEQKVGPRTSVITEPSQMAACAAELSDLETLLSSVESYLINYEWDEYKILVLPPSFPFGGMENPLLTFASPTIIVGDKSQVYVATHEIAHSWTGNQVTCANWENYWLNEGFTVFTERKISGQIYGYNFAQTEAYLNNKTMWDNMLSYGLDSNYTQLDPIQFFGVNPDNTEGEVSYEKGYQFLVFLESLVGEDTFQQFMRSYIQAFSGQSVIDLEMRTFFLTFIAKTFDPATAQSINSAIDWNEWFYGKGLPPVTADFMNDDIAAAQLLAQQYIRLGGIGSPDGYQKFNNYYMNQKVVFVQELLDNKDSLNADAFHRIQNDLNVQSIKNLEFRMRWDVLGINLKIKERVTDAQAVVGSMGRILYLTPIYTALVNNGFRDNANHFYQINEAFYSPLARNAIQSILGNSESKMTLMSSQGHPSVVRY
ncbi:peptidase family m1 containing protein [Stylonychia lemnae]|uniref:Peptidase family m1 containing protein n=1 Tax=Stylonychia lemnae TaxID=5949 RepID=A0A078AZY7_STYLE|nr:peptidase family m1 containing protein [Stylonychia lemnae]|eukprot:CDW86353.1 peptidase family m1 containing protein [Stylonychia lemnae]